MRSLGGPEEYCCVARGQRNKNNYCQESGHSHRCIAPSPPISLHSFDPRDIYGVYPNNFGNMAAKDDATKEEVSASQQGPIPARTRSRSRPRSARCARGRPAAPRAVTKSTKVGQQSILAILNSATKVPPPRQVSPAIPPAPPLFSTIAGKNNSPTTAPVPTALASATVGMSAAVQKHKPILSPSFAPPQVQVKSLRQGWPF